MECHIMVFQTFCKRFALSKRLHGPVSGQRLWLQAADYRARVTRFCLVSRETEYFQSLPDRSRSTLRISVAGRGGA
ncbi:hypothetical protein, partial [Pseudomonas syringae]|uniref:hypothetical protein n=1 Tax=Pseudomonas syringae TaxID=317 RepID=UPI001F2DFD16